MPQLAYLGIEVPDPASLDAFFGDTIGLVAGAPTASGAHTWRNDDRVHRILVEPGDAGDATFLGFEVDGLSSLDDVVERLATIGHPAEPDPALAERRRVEHLVRTTTPWGVQLEVVVGLARAPEGFHSPAMPGGFHTDGVGFGHVVFGTTAFDESIAFLTEGLGLAQTDWLEMELAPGVVLEVRFFHCNPRHHSVALARAPFDLPQVLHHVMVEARDRDDVGRAFDRAWATDLPIPNGLGRHDNDGMFSFYVQSPAGFQVEVGHGGREVGPDWDDDRRYDRISAWGHQPLRGA